MQGKGGLSGARGVTWEGSPGHDVTKEGREGMIILFSTESQRN